MLGVIGCFVAITGTAAVSIVSAKSRNAYCFFRISTEPPKRLLDHHIFWSHTSLVTQVVYSSASARRTASRLGELLRSSRWTHLLTVSLPQAIIIGFCKQRTSRCERCHNEPSHQDIRCLTFSLKTLHINFFPIDGL